MKNALIFFASLMILVSCQGEKEDEALVAKHRKQAEEIDILEDELREVRAAIEEVEVPDEFPDLDKLKAEMKEATGKRGDLEKESRILEAKKKKALEDFEKYQETYPIR